MSDTRNHEKSVFGAANVLASGLKKGLAVRRPASTTPASPRSTAASSPEKSPLKALVSNNTKGSGWAKLN